MTGGVQLAYGQAATGRLISIGEAERGAACGCVCPECGSPLIAKKGDEIAHHFAHEADAECSGALETTLHILAKQTIADAGQVWFPEVVARAYGDSRYFSGGGVFEAATIQLEYRLEAPDCPTIVPDAILAHANQTKLAVEIYVTHAVTPEKAARYAELGLPCIEIDLSAHHGPHRLSTPADHLPDIILRTAPRRWVYSPRIATAEAEMRADHDAKMAEQARERAAREQARQAHEAERLAQLTEEQRQLEEQRKAEHEAALIRQVEWQRKEDERLAVLRAAWEQQERERQAELAAKRAKVTVYRNAERAKATAYAPDPREWRFALRILASRFLPQNVADEWLARPTTARPDCNIHFWPVNEPPDAATLNGMYDELWAEIKRQGRYRGP